MPTVGISSAIILVLLMTPIWLNMIALVLSAGTLWHWSWQVSYLTGDAKDATTVKSGTRFAASAPSARLSSRCLRAVHVRGGNALGSLPWPACWGIRLDKLYRIEALDLVVLIVDGKKYR